MFCTINCIILLLDFKRLNIENLKFKNKIIGDNLSVIWYNNQVLIFST